MQPWRWLPPALLFAAAIISIGLPADWLRPLDFIGSAVCHRIAERSFFAGFNSYWVLLTDQTLFYPPQNWLRLTTGAGMGLALCSFAVILANQVLWPAPARVPLVASLREFLRLLLLPASVIAVVLWRPDPLYGPLAVISSAGVLVMLTLANSLLAVITLRRQGQINRLGQLGLPALLGLLLTLAEITVLNLLRAALLGL
jgi:apolipoprotein N-acyltransferase